jgi:hypothetical protein
VSVRRIDFHGRDWSAHSQDHWLDRAGDHRFPDYLRIVFVAYGRHSANGHAKLERGELAYYLIREDASLPDRRSIYRSIQKAVALGLILDVSHALCLVVSSHDVQGGRGNPDARCRRDHTRRHNRTTTREVVTQPRTTTPTVVTQQRTTTPHVVVPRLASLSSTNPHTPKPHPSEGSSSEGAA